MTAAEIMTSLREQLEADARDDLRAAELLDQVETASLEVRVAPVLVLEPTYGAPLAVAS